MLIDCLNIHYKTFNTLSCNRLRGKVSSNLIKLLNIDLTNDNFDNF